MRMCPESNPDGSSVYDEFLQFEVEANAFDVEIRGIPVWELIRFGTFRKIVVESGLQQGTPSSPVQERIGSKAIEVGRGVLGNVIRNNPYFAGDHDVVIYGHQRRKKLDDGYWWDIYVDPIIEQTDLDYVYLEERYHGSHRTPAKTDDVRHVEFMRDLARLWRRSGIRVDEIREDELSDVRRLEQRITERFDVDIDIASTVQHSLSIRKPLLSLYRAFLRRTSPGVAIVLVSYGRELFVEACKQRDIPVVELQHGVIHPNHFGYSYPGTREKRTFPDYLLTYGEFWRDIVEYPIADEDVVPVGYPFLEAQVKRYSDVQPEDQIVVVSQLNTGDRLSTFALELTDRVKSDVVLKLHPAEYDDWQELYPELIDSDLRIIEGDDPPLYEILARSHTQVGVGSTVLFEGLLFDLETVILDVPGPRTTRYLVDSGYAKEIASAAEFTHGNDGTTSIDTEYFFESNAIENISTFLDRFR